MRRLNRHCRFESDHCYQFMKSKTIDQLESATLIQKQLEDDILKYKNLPTPTVKFEDGTLRGPIKEAKLTQKNSKYYDSVIDELTDI